MQINDDDIRAAFAWPVRYDHCLFAVVDDTGIIGDFREWQGIAAATHIDKKAAEVVDYIGEAIAAMLNERFAPGKSIPCRFCERPIEEHRRGDNACFVGFNDLTGEIRFHWHRTNRFTPKGADDGQATDKK